MTSDDPTAPVPVPVPVPVQSLLPPNATPRELSIEGADASIGDLDVTQIITARDVENCPSAYLPYLAWERSVWTWDPTWSDATKRAVIAAAPEVHRYIGTAYAVRTALTALDVDAILTEWWQQSPPGVPYTFSVVSRARSQLYPGAPILDARLTKVVFSTILRTKPVSRAFDLVLAADMPATLGLAPIAVATTKVSVAVVPKMKRTVAATLGLAPVALAATKVAVVMAPRNHRKLAADLGLAPVVVGRVRVAVAVTL